MSKSKMQARTVLDWLRFTIPYEYDKNDSIPYLSNNCNPLRAYHVKTESAQSLLYAVINALSMDGVNYTDASIQGLANLSKASLGYDGTWVICHVRVMYKEMKEYMPLSQIKMGVCVEISSHGLRDIENSKDFTTWNAWLKNFKDIFPNAQCTRIDLASDFFKDLHHLTPRGLRDIALGKGHRKIVSLPKYHNYIERIDSKAQQVVGSCYYIGDRRNSYMLRAYDKYEERLFAHGDSWLKHHKIKNWTRYEIQCNKKTASHVIGLLANGVSAAQIWLDLIRKLMYIEASPSDKKHGRSRFIEVQVYSVKKRDFIKKVVEVPYWWAEFVDFNNIPSFDYTGKTPHWTYDRHMDWIGRAVLPSFIKDLIAVIYEGGDPDTYFNHIINQGMSKLQPRDVDDIVNYLKSIKVSKFKKNNNQFAFTKTITQISDRVTGMIGQRLYDMRNDGKFDKESLHQIQLQNYIDFINEYGIANDIAKLRANGVIGNK